MSLDFAVWNEVERRVIASLRRQAATLSPEEIESLVIVECERLAKTIVDNCSELYGKEE